MIAGTHCGANDRRGCTERSVGVPGQLSPDVIVDAHLGEDDRSPRGGHAAPQISTVVEFLA